MTMTSASYLVLVFVLIVTCSLAEPATEFVEASDGGSAQLPCSLTSGLLTDKISVVLWYRGADESPIYKYDMRGSYPQHWADASLGNRFFLRILDENRAVLTVSPIKQSDEETYHCRVDFQNTPTRITHVSLIVIVSPTSVQVSDDFGEMKNGLTTSYAEGASLTLTCTATGGKPLPKVSWYKEDETVFDETKYFPERQKSLSILKIVKLTRSHLLTVYSCRVSNSKMQPPLVVRIAVDMFLRPLDVSLLGNNPEFSAGKPYNITCRCRGSRPPAIITWWKDGVSLEGGIVSVSADGNTTTSTLSFTPSSADHGLILTCKASNPRIPFSEQQRTWMLRVHYPPKVSLTLGHGLNADDIKEGADVYFECHLIANPWVYRVWWLRNGERLLSNSTAGVIVSNQTLVLQGTSRQSSGRYCCEATNKEGTSTSPPFHLRVKFEPVCSEGVARKVLGAAKDEPLQVDCKVDAEPVASNFRWSFNSTPGISRELNEYSSSAGRSVLTFIPRVAADYGTLQCWGSNAIGDQRLPCTYHIVPAGKPDPPHTCSASNITHHSAILMCSKGFDGGLRQKFFITLNMGAKIMYNLTSLSIPEFNISNLEAASEYTIIAFSVNLKGLSKPSAPLIFQTLPAPELKEQRRSTDAFETASFGSGPWLYICLAAGSTLIVAGAICVIVFAVRKFKVDSPVRNHRNVARSPKINGNAMMAQPIFTDPISDDNNPDLIPPLTEGLLDSSIVPYTITARPSGKRNSATQMPVKPYHVTWAPILQSRNCSTQTPPPHKESSV